MRTLRWLVATAVIVALAPGSGQAQEPTRITGRVTSETGAGVASAQVTIPTLNVGTLTDQNGNFMLLVPAARVQAGQEVRIRAQSLGFRAQEAMITLRPGATLEQNFQLGIDVLELEGIVATGQGLERSREKLAATINSVNEREIAAANESNIVGALAGKAPNVQVVTSSGEPGAGSYIRIRGAASVVGGTQPLIVVDGTPIVNESHAIVSTAAGTAVQNRAADINPNDIQSVDILKGAAAAALYGSRAANGVVVITTKSGQVGGGTRASLTSTVGFDRVNETVPLQRRFGRGLVNVNNPTQNLAPSTSVTWGPELPAGTPVFDHTDEIFDRGVRFDNNLQLSGGSERTTYFLSVGALNHDGYLQGPNSAMDKYTARLKGSHQFRDDLEISGNFAYSTVEARYVQQGSNISGLLLGALRTPPEFDNRQYIDPATGLHRSYRCNEVNTQCPGGGSFFSIDASRGYDNPFWILNEIPTTSGVGHFFGNVNLNYRPVDWLRINSIVSADYANDQRSSLFPKSSSELPSGQVIRADLLDESYDFLITGTAQRQFNENTNVELTLGANLNERQFTRYQVQGLGLIQGGSQLDFTIDRDPDEYRESIRTAGYFTEANVDLFDQVFLTGRLRLDGANTFGSDDNFFLYPAVSAAWQFDRHLRDRFPALSFAKLRTSWGIVGRQPPAFTNVTAFGTPTFGDGWLSNGLSSIYGGQEGLAFDDDLGNVDIDPERKTDFEAGLDLAFLENRAALSLTYFTSDTDDAILPIDIPPSTGFVSLWANAAAFNSKGWELELDLVPVQGQRFGWNIGLQASTLKTCVTSVESTEEFGLAGFVSMTSSVVAPGPDGECHPFGALYGGDFVRFGRGIEMTVDVNGDGTAERVNIDEAFPNARPGDLFIGADGFPRMDPQERVVGDPNPRFTWGIRNTFTVGNNLRISALVDAAQGHQMWNGTKGALFFFGTHEFTLPMHGAGSQHVFGCGEPANGEVRTCQNPQGVAGPGVGQEVPLNWATWTVGGLGSGFTGPGSQFIEDADYVKLRDVSVSYVLDQRWLRNAGFSSVDLTVSGQNLITWTDYSGIDPESNLTAQSSGRGLDYFNNPRTRSWVFKVTLNR